MIANFGALLALLSSLFLAVGGWLQWRGLLRLEAGARLWRAVREPLWVLGMGASAGGTVIYHAALWLAPITVVQPLSSLHVAFTALLSWKGRHVAVREWTALGFCAAGTLLLALSDRPEVADKNCHWSTLAALVTAGVFLLLLPFPRRLAKLSFPWRAGICYGLAAVLWKAGTVLPLFGMSWWGLMVLFAAGFIGGFLFLQAAFRRLDAGTANALAASVGALFPLPAGLWVFREEVGACLFLATALTAAGVALLGSAAGTQDA